MEGMGEYALYFKTFIFYVTNQAILDTNQAQSRVFPDRKYHPDHFLDDHHRKGFYLPRAPFEL